MEILVALGFIAICCPVVLGCFIVAEIILIALMIKDAMEDNDDTDRSGGEDL